MAETLKYDLIADVPTAGTPIVAVMAHKLWRPMITPREPKTHGAGGVIDGVYELGQQVLLVDDLITKADSKLEAVRTLEAAGLVVPDILVLVDRGQGGVRQLTEAGYRVHVVTTLELLLGRCVQLKRISREMYQEVEAYLGFGSAGA